MNTDDNEEVREDADTHASAQLVAYEQVDEADRHLPIANISRIMKKVLPTSSQVSKDAKAYIQLCVSEFISFVTSEASDKCLQEKRKTINGDDVLWALTAMGFDNYADPLKIYLKKYRDVLKGPEFSAKKQKLNDDSKEGKASSKKKKPNLSENSENTSFSGTISPPADQDIDNLPEEKA